LKKALKKPINVKKIEKSYMKKRGKLNHSTGKDWTQFRERMSNSVDTSRRHARMCTWI